MWAKLDRAEHRFYRYHLARRRFGWELAEPSKAPLASRPAGLRALRHELCGNSGRSPVGLGAHLFRSTRKQQQIARIPGRSRIEHRSAPCRPQNDPGLPWKPPPRSAPHPPQIRALSTRRSTPSLTLLFPCLLLSFACREVVRCGGIGRGQHTNPIFDVHPMWRTHSRASNFSTASSACGRPRRSRCARRRWRPHALRCSTTVLERRPAQLCYFSRNMAQSGPDSAEMGRILSKSVEFGPLLVGSVGGW